MIRRFAVVASLLVSALGLLAQEWGIPKDLTRPWAFPVNPVNVAKDIPPAKDDGIGPDVAASIALVVPEFLGQVARGKRQGEEAGDGDAATIDHAPHGVTQKEMESSTEQVER